MRARHEIRETWIQMDGDERIAVLLEVLLDIRDLLTETRDREYVAGFVSPNYRSGEQFIRQDQWKCPGCGSILGRGTRHRCPGPRRHR